jgi:hypothetical protein
VAFTDPSGLEAQGSSCYYNYTFNPLPSDLFLSSTWCNTYGPSVAGRVGSAISGAYGTSVDAWAQSNAARTDTYQAAGDRVYRSLDQGGDAGLRNAEAQLALAGAVSSGATHYADRVMYYNQFGQTAQEVEAQKILEAHVYRPTYEYARSRSPSCYFFTGLNTLASGMMLEPRMTGPGYQLFLLVSEPMATSCSD